MSWRRVALLVALGASSAAAFTRPGQWVAWELLEPLRPKSQMCWPLTLRLVGAGSRGVQLLRSCSDLCVDFDDPRRGHPTLEIIGDRISAIDGWSTAVLYDAALGPGPLYAAGLDIETCGRIVLARWGRPSAEALDPASWPRGYWRILLLDDQGWGVASVYFSVQRPGWARSETDPDSYEACPSAPGDPDLPPVCIFRRGTDGKVHRG